MNKVILTSRTFDGQITLIFGVNNYLLSYNSEAELSDKQHEFFTDNFPYSFDKLKELLLISKSLEAEIIHKVPTFDEFWDTYDFKVDKPLALKEWTKMNDKEMIQAVLNISPYDKYLEASGEGKIYPVRYLKRKRYEVDYKALLKNIKKKY